MLILLIALTLIVLKLGFLLLLVAGPFFLIIGTHPGFGRIIAIRWFEMLVGVLMKQAAIAIVLSVLLYCYSLIMGTADTVLPWALKIILIALVTVAVFIYRRPFTHLFSAVGYGTLGSAERADVSLREAGVTFRRNTMTAASVAVPGVAGARAARWARRNPGQAAAVAAGVTGAAGAAAAAAVSGETAAGTAGGDAYASRFRGEAPAAADGETEPSRAAAPGLGRSRDVPEAGGGPSRTPPPLDLPPRNGGSAPARAASTWAGRGQGPAARGPAPSRSRTTGTGTASGPAGSAPVRSAPPASRSSAAGPAARPAGGTSSGGGSGSRPPAPSWPLSGSGGSPAAGPRSRPAAERRPAPGRAAPSQPPPSQSAPSQPAPSSPAGGDTSGEPRAMPFWLRPRRK
jgi:hypothetical protein